MLVFIEGEYTDDSENISTSFRFPPKNFLRLYPLVAITWPIFPQFSCGSGRKLQLKSIDYLLETRNYISGIIYLAVVLTGPTGLVQHVYQCLAGDQSTGSSLCRDSTSLCQGVFMDGRVPDHGDKM